MILIPHQILMEDMAVLIPLKVSIIRTGPEIPIRLTAPTIRMGRDGASREVIDREFCRKFHIYLSELPEGSACPVKPFWLLFHRGER